MPMDWSLCLPSRIFADSDSKHIILPSLSSCSHPRFEVFRSVGMGVTDDASHTTMTILESQSLGSIPRTEISGSCGPMDILAGRIVGKLKEDRKENIGTKLFEETIAGNLQTYDQDDSRSNRSHLTRKVVDELSGKGCRFMRYNNRAGFISLDEKQVRDEVSSFSLRHQSTRQHSGMPWLTGHTPAITSLKPRHFDNIPGTLVARCGPMDILAGRVGKPKGIMLLASHIGTKLFEEAIAKDLQAYRANLSRQSRSNLIKGVVDELLAQGCRFLKYDSSVGMFIVLDKKQIRDKVSFAFRHRSREQCRGSCQEQSQGRPRYQSKQTGKSKTVKNEDDGSLAYAESSLLLDHVGHDIALSRRTVLSTLDQDDLFALEPSEEDSFSRKALSEDERDHEFFKTIENMDFEVDGPNLTQTDVDSELAGIEFLLPSYDQTCEGSHVV